MPSDLHVNSSEITLILACLRAHYESGNRSKLLQLARDKAASGQLVENACRHGIVPLVYEALSPDFACLPPEVSTALRQEFQASAANSFLYGDELARLSEFLQRRSIPALAFKGPALAAVLYGKLSLRTVRDLDILVPPEQMDRALEALQELGYAPDPRRPDWRAETHLAKHVLLIHKNAGFQVELHWAIAERSFGFGLSFDKLWAARREIAVQGAPVETISPEDLLLLLSAHGTNHCWGSLKWVCDIAEAMRAFPNLDWDHLLMRARALGCRRMLLVGAGLAADICSVDLPGPVQRALAYHAAARIMCREIRSRLFASRPLPVDLERTLIFVRSRERLRDRLRILATFLATKLRPGARDRALIHLPGSLEALYIPIRLLRLLLTYWRRAIVPIIRGALGQVWPRGWAMLPPE